MLRDQLLDIIGYGIEALFETDRGAERCVARAEDEPLRKHLGANAHVHVPLVKPRRLQCATRDVRHLQVQGEVRGGVRRGARSGGRGPGGGWAGPAYRRKHVRPATVGPRSDLRVGVTCRHLQADRRNAAAKRDQGCVVVELEQGILVHHGAKDAHAGRVLRGLGGTRGDGHVLSLLNG